MRTESFPSAMLRLNTIGPAAIWVGDARVPTANQQAFSALLYLVVEGGKPAARRTLMELFFPDASDDAGAHSLRQLLYRLRKMGVEVDADTLTVGLPADTVTWDVEALLTRGWASDEELNALQRGYLADYAPDHSEHFSQWLDQHRAFVSNKLRHLLIAQLQAERSQRHFRALENVARACLALDPLNEEATLAAAESLAMAGSKVEAIALLDNYLGEIGPRAKELKIPPRILRERISEYVVDPDLSEKVPLIGREKELNAISALIEQSRNGSARACIVTGQSGIGKTRLLNEACSLAALAGHAIVRGKLHPHDARRPFAILRDIGPALLDLPGAIGASPESLAAIRGLCGRGPSQFQALPDGAFEIQAIVAEVHARFVELVDAIAAEQPVVISIEDAHWIDEASLELLVELLDDRRAVCVVIASQRHSLMPPRVSSRLGMTDLELRPLSNEESSGVLATLFDHAKRNRDNTFIQSAASISAGVPFYLHVLFRDFQRTGDSQSIPSGLSASLAARLDQLKEPAKSVFDAIVILGSNSSEAHLETLTQLPRYALLEALRTLDEQGMVRISNNALTASHDLFAAAASKRMPHSVARLLHLSAAKVLESAGPGDAEPLALAGHWEACGEDSRALNVLTRSADRSRRLGRPREAIVLLRSAQKVAHTPEDHDTVVIALFSACRAAQHFGEANEYASQLNLQGGLHGKDLQIDAIDSLYSFGGSLISHKGTLESLARDKTGSTSRRAAAAKLLVIIAEETQDAALARWAVDSLTDLEPDSYEVLLSRLICETAFGSHSEAIDTATRLCDAAFASGAIAPKLESLPNAALSLWRSGCVERALEYTTRAYIMANSERIWTACIHLSGLIANIRWYSGDVAGAREWTEICAMHIERTGLHDRGALRYSLGVMFALEDNDPDAASRLLAEAERLFPRVLEHRHALEALAYKVRIDLARDNPIEKRTADQFLEGHLARRGAGMHDIVADTAIALLKHLGKPEAAEERRKEYLSDWRKDGFPPAPQLRHLHSPEIAASN